MTKPPTLDPTWVTFTTDNLFVDPITTLPVTVIANYDHNGNLLYTEAYNNDGTIYTGDLSVLIVPSNFFLNVIPLLTSIDGKLTLGQQVMADSLAVVIASDQTPIPIAGAITGDINLIEVGGVAIALGQALMAASIPVVLASDQSVLPISAASLPLPAGAATSANQTTIIGHLDGVEALLTTIDADTSNLDVLLSTRLAEATFTSRINTLGQKVMAASTPVVIASDQSTLPVSIISAVASDVNLIEVGGSPIALGQALMTASFPVVLASDQSTLPISAASLPLPAGAATSANQVVIIGHLDGVEALLTTIDGDTSNLDVLLSTRLAEATFTSRINTLGQKVMAASTPVVIASDQSAIPVSITSTITGDVNLIEVGGVAIALGQALMVASIPVVLASDQSVLPISAAALPLPAGAATSANQTTIIGHLDGVEALLTTIDGDTSNLDVLLSTRLAEATFTSRINTLGQKVMATSTPVVIASDQSDLPISAASLPLPAGAATSANQTTIIGHLDGVETLLTTIDADTSNLDVLLSTRLAEATFTSRINTLGQKVMAASTPVVIASDQSAIDVNVTGSVVTGDVNLIEVGGVAIALGQALMVASIPVVLASDQSVLPISAAALPLPAGAATAANQTTIIGHLDGVEALLTTIDADTSNLDVLLSTRLAEATFTSRINTLGQKVMASSTPVVIASDQSDLPISVASLPLPAGAATLAEQQIQTASLSVLDDWDEADRAKVNLIVGQAGVDANTGVVSVTTLRVTLATDVALPAGTNNIGDVDILSLIPGFGATNLGKREDDPHASLDVGVMALGVRRDTLVAGAGADGDYEAVPIAKISTTIGVPSHIVGTIALPIISDVAGGAALNTTSAIPVAGPDQTTGNKGNIESAAAAVTTSTARGMVVRQQGIPTSTSLSDSTSNPTTQLLGAMNMIYNGSTWSRRLQAANALNSTGTGIANSALVGQLDDTSPTTITENQFGHVRITPRRALLTGSEIQSRSDTYTTTANGTTIDLGAGSALKYFTVQVIQTGVVTAWDIRLEGSLDGTNFSQIIAHTNADGTGIVKASSVFPVRYFRSRCAGITLGVGTNVIAYILGSN